MGFDSRLLLLFVLFSISVGQSTRVDAAEPLEVVGTFAQPTYVGASVTDVARVYVVEHAGVVRLVKAGVVVDRPFIDLSPSGANLVTHPYGPLDERGAFSIAFAPDYESSGRFYLSYTRRSDGAVQVDEFRRSANVDVADPATRRPLITIGGGAGNHNGGQLQTGPDGMLWIGLGDGGDSDGAADPHHYGQNLTGDTGADRHELWGKILRIDPQGSPYRIPTGNPSPSGATAPPEMWLYGVRNPWRFSFDRATGDLVVGDVGAGSAGEVDFASQADGTGRGRNLEWSVVEGNRLFSNSSCCSPVGDDQHPPNHLSPLLEKVDGGWCSLTGGYVVRDPALPDLLGRYVYGDFCDGSIRSVNLRASGASGDADSKIAPSGARRIEQLASFGEDACGHVYVVSLSGPVYRVGKVVGCNQPLPPSPAPSGEPAPAWSPGTGGATTTGASLRLVAKSPQRPTRTGSVSALARCRATCSVRVSLVVTARTGRHHLAAVATVSPVTRRLRAGVSTPVRIVLSVKARRSIASALRRHRAVTATLTARVVSPRGGATATSAVVRFNR